MTTNCTRTLSPRARITDLIIMVLTTQLSAALCLFAAVIQLAACAHNLEEDYRFSASLDDGYKLHWNFDLKQQTIAFAVNVSSTGWVGFGLSPNGQMPQSDVVIGWVDNDGTANFHVSWSKSSPMQAHHADTLCDNCC